MARVFGVEMSTGRLVVVEASRRKIHAAHVLALPDPAPEGFSVAGLLARTGISPGDLHLVAWDSEQVHQLLTLPPMSAAERMLYLRRELTRDGGPRAIGAEVVRRITDGAPKDEVLAVAAPSEAVERLVGPFLATAATPRLVTTGPLALVAAARALVSDLDAAPAVLAHLGFSGLTVVVVAAGRLTLARQIPRLAAPGLDPLEWAGTEIQRSVRHYAMTSKGQTAARVVFATRVAAMERLFCESGQLEKRLGLPVVNLNEAFRAILPEGAEERAGPAAGGLLLAFGAATLTPHRVANLLPAPMLAAQRSRAVTRRALAAGLIVTLGLGAVYGWATRDVRRLRADLARVRLERQVNDVRARDVATIQAERQRTAGRVRLLLDDPLAQPPVADALREVSRLAPDGLRLQVLSITRGDRGLALALSGVIADDDLAAAQRDFNRLYFGLRDSPLFYDVTFVKRPAVVTPGAVAAQPASTTAVPSIVGPFAFDVGLRLKQVR